MKPITNEHGQPERCNDCKCMLSRQESVCRGTCDACQRIHERILVTLRATGGPLCYLGSEMFGDRRYEIED